MSNVQYNGEPATSLLDANADVHATLPAEMHAHDQIAWIGGRTVVWTMTSTWVKVPIYVQ